LRLYARHQKTPRAEEYHPSRLADELADIVYYKVETARELSRLVIQSNGTRMSGAYGNTGKGRYLDEYLGARRRDRIQLTDAASGNVVERNSSLACAGSDR
jgi:hypothetical protein